MFFMKFNVYSDRNIWNMIKSLNDTQLMTKIAGGDLIAMDAKYHLSCMVNLRNRCRFYNHKASQTSETQKRK